MKDKVPQLKHWLLFGAIPAIVILIALRQAYLNAYHHLSTWKGGGMGMFAGADHSRNRFTRIYIEFPNGERQPVINLGATQIRLRERALWYPSLDSFQELARSIRRTKLVAANRQFPVHYRDRSGKLLQPTGTSYYELNVMGPRKDSAEPDWILVIEYWEISYDSAKHLARANLVKTMRFPEGDS